MLCNNFRGHSTSAAIATVSLKSASERKFKVLVTRTVRAQLFGVLVHECTACFSLCNIGIAYNFTNTLVSVVTLVCPDMTILFLFLHARLPNCSH